jgi:polar amino acid transport system ATP-binding protein/general L-amino acid transport system ATP-binding protein
MTTTSQAPVIQLRGVNKFFGTFQALKNIDLDVRKGERIVVCGPSGSGKSTLIRCINRLEEHSSGQIIVDGKELTDKVDDIDAVRREVGMVFQSFNLFPHMTILKNLTLAQRLVRKTPKAEAERTAMLYLERVKIPEQAHKYPIQLSGGQQQRVAIARSLANSPQLILADEPTGELDSHTARQVLGLMRDLAHQQGVSILMATHDPLSIEYADQVLDLKDGTVAAVIGKPAVAIT